jgi:hypothetical protein
MALAPRTLPADEPFDDLEAFLEHLHLHLLACPATQAFAAPIGALLADLSNVRAAREDVARALFALKAKEIFFDDDLNNVLDQVKEALAADKSEAGVALYRDVFEGKSPSEVRKYVLGPQLTMMAVWPGKLAAATSPNTQKLGQVAKQVTGDALQLLNDIGSAEMALEQYDLAPRAAFVEACNAAVKLVYGKVSELEHTTKLPPGFVDRFFLRDTSGRIPTVKELEAAVGRTRTKLARQEALLEAQRAKQAQDRKTKQQAALAQKRADAATAKQAADEAAAELARLQAEIEKEEKGE